MLEKGITNLQQLIANMEPVLNEGEYVFLSVQDSTFISREFIICEMKEKEGITLVLPKAEADQHKLDYEFVAAWITLNVHSALEAVGLTAAFAMALGQHNISANVIAGYYHDHIFVDVKDGERAVEVLQTLAKKASDST